MNDWTRYLRENADRDVWGLVLVDYYLRLQEQEPREPPSDFLARLLPEIWHNGLDIVAFHNVLLCVAVQLLGTDFDAIVTMSLRLLGLQGPIASTELDAVADQYRPYGKRDYFLSRVPRTASKDGAGVTARDQNPSLAGRSSQVPVVPLTATARVGLTRGVVEKRVGDALARLAQPHSSSVPRQKYMADFAASGRRKGDEFLRQLRAVNFPEKRIAVVSIGGADGSELDHILRNGDFSTGFLLEFDHEAAELARQKGAALLKEEGKRFEVYEGDATMSIPQVTSHLRALVSEGAFDGIAYSINAVLHELPSRAGRFDVRPFLHGLLEGWKTCAIVIREPCRPDDWPAAVEMKSDLLSGPYLERLATFVANWRQFKGKIHVAADEFVRMPSRVAIEVLFKLFHIDDLEYELEESVTSFDARSLRNALVTELGVAGVSSTKLNSVSFDRFYGEYGIQVRNLKAQALDKPMTFVALRGIRLA